MDNGKARIECELYKIINEKFDVEWKQNSTEYFECKITDFKEIYRTVRNKLEKFESNY